MEELMVEGRKVNGWMDRRMDGWIGGGLVVGGWKEGRNKGKVHGSMDGKTEGRIDGWRDGSHQQVFIELLKTWRPHGANR